jgi:hypothetical protein
MKSKLFASFGIGALTATISLGAIQYVSASGSNTITACANKSTGTMRYITKGSCKKTETRISWNQQGPQGPQGESGVKGDTGAKGEAGSNGKTLQLIDATGKVIGYVVGDGQAGGLTPKYLTLVGDKLWLLNSTSYEVSGSLGNENAYSDSACTQPLGVVFEATTPPSQLTYGFTTGADQTYSASGIYASGTDMSKAVWKQNATCDLMTLSERQSEFSQKYLYSLTPVPPPTYVAPLVFVGG